MNPSLKNPLCYYTPPQKTRGTQLSVDLCVFGATSGGIVAAIAAKKKGLGVALLEPGKWLGGMSASGLGFTDLGNKAAIGGLAREFYSRVGKKRGCDIYWRLEPQIAEAVFREWLQEWDIACHFESCIESVQTSDGRLARLVTQNGLDVCARRFIDATYEGDLMARAGVSYTVGRESNSTYNERLNGQQLLDKHQFKFAVDPYLVEGKPASGLLPGVGFDSAPYTPGAADFRVQAYNFRLCMTDDPKKIVPFSQPDDYDPARYELLRRYCRSGYIPQLFNGPVAEGVYDVNNMGAVSTDFIGMNHDWPDGDYATREAIFQTHVSWTRGLVWFWCHDDSVHDDFRKHIRRFGWNREAFADTGHFPHALYIREARRMVGDYVMTEHNCLGRVVAEDPVALASYTMDSHNCRRLVANGKAMNEGDVQVHSGPPYPISYRSIVPKAGECRNLLVPFCLSASHIAFGSIRMEPVFMMISEAAAEAALITLENEYDVQDVPYAMLRERLESAGQVLDPVPAAASSLAGE